MADHGHLAHVTRLGHTRVRLTLIALTRLDLDLERGRDHGHGHGRDHGRGHGHGHDHGRDHGRGHGHGIGLTRALYPAREAGPVGDPIRGLDRGLAVLAVLGSIQGGASVE